MARNFGPPPFNDGIVTEKYTFASTWGKLIVFCKPYFTGIVITFIFAIAGTIFTLVGPDYLKDMTNKIAEGLHGQLDMDAITKIGLTLTIFYALSVVLSYSQEFIMSTITQKVSKSMRTKISEKINRLPLKYFDKNSIGDVLSRVTNDVDSIGQTLNQSVGSVVSSITQFVGTLILMFYTEWRLALITIATSVIGAVLLPMIISRSQKYFVEQQQALGDIGGHIEEVYNGHNVVKVYNAEEGLRKEFHEINRRLYLSGWKSQFISGVMHPIMNFIGNLGYVSVCVFGATLAMKGTISFGVIIAFIIYVRLFTRPLAQIAQAATSLQTAGAASFRVFSFLEEEELADESDKTLSLDTIKGDVEFKNVQFGYNEDKIIIKNFSASVKAGQKIAIVGPTGAGKTTMVNLLMRFYELNMGEIAIDSVPTSSLTRENVHRFFCMVLQDTWIFEGTIKENIVYCKENIPDEEIVKVCKAVGIHHFIKTLPMGYDTVLDDNASISSGQRQLITIARAMIQNAPMLILDEATSSVDTRTEILIQEAMDRLMVGRTSFIIAHRLSTIKNADLILVMKDGDIVESGTHDNLIAENGFYAELYNSQFDNVS